MDAEGQDLGPHKPVSDALILAAIERAICHGAEQAWIAVVGEHLGFQWSAHNTRRLRLQLEHLRVKRGWVASDERHGREYWRLTAAGRRRLAQARRKGELDELPESPQHRDWRLARAAATDRIDGFRELVYEAVEDAGEVMVVPQGAHNSATWLELAERLRAALWLMGSATYCLEEWAEPDDAHPDTDANPGPAPGRRVTSAWDKNEATAKGAER